MSRKFASYLGQCIHSGPGNSHLQQEHIPSFTSTRYGPRYAASSRPTTEPSCTFTWGRPPGSPRSGPSQLSFLLPHTWYLSPDGAGCCAHGYCCSWLANTRTCEGKNSNEIYFTVNLIVGFFAICGFQIFVNF